MSRISCGGSGLTSMVVSQAALAEGLSTEEALRGRAEKLVAANVEQLLQARLPPHTV